MAGIMTRVSVMLRMNLALLRREIDAMSIFWACVGVLLALGTLAIPFTPGIQEAALVDVLALAFGVWLLMMMVAPMFGGGGGIRAEHLALLPVPPRQLAVGLLGAAVVGIGPAVLLLAFVSLVIYGFQLGVAAGLVSIMMTLLQFMVVLLLGRVVYGLMGQAMRTRLGMELVAFQFGLLFASFSVGWFAIEPVTRQTERLLTDGLPPLMSGIVRALPSGWGLLAVEAAGRADWLKVVGVLLGFVVLIAGLVWVWSALLARSMLGRGSSRIGRGNVTSDKPAAVTARTPLESVIFKEWKAWMRDPWRALEFRIALWTGVFTGLIPLVVGLTDFMPFAGVVMVLMGGMGSANLYGLDGSALWQTLLTPGAERLDVRGRQWAWLRLFGPASLVVTVIFTALSGQTWAWPVVLGVLPAVLGAVTGLTILISVFMASPGIDPQHRRNPMDSSGGDIGGPFLLLFLAGVIAALPAWVTFNGLGSENALLQWAGVPVGIIIGVALAWGCGVLAYKRLESRGPELLNFMLKGTTPVKAKTEEAEIWKEMSRKDRILVGVCQSLFWLPLFPQGLAALGFKLGGLEEKSWFLALYLPELLQWPVIFAMIALGVWMLYIAIEIPRKYKRERAGE